ncbi:MAG TPA: AAA family ATPase [Terriglobales bacterium]|nr:AAA family ATPase [Terriglobales bacterium]
MYESFYGLKRGPFEITPDPAFLFPTKRHNEALAALYYGVRWRKGFVVLTGQVGTGKTLILRCLLQLLKQSKDVAYAYVFNSRLQPTEFLQYIASDFGLPTTGKNKAELLFDLCNFVVNRGLNNLTTVLIVDEAHHLSSEALEEIRLLTNLETAQQKLLQIVLVGQPELDDKLDSVKLTQLKQRIAIRSHLEPLDFDEIKGYIGRRLQLVCTNQQPDSIFPPKTVATIYRHSRGIPRLVNTICENSLISAYAQQLPGVTPEIVDEVAKDFRLNIVRPAEADKSSGFDEIDLQRAARILLDLYASMQKSLVHEPPTPAPITARFKQA